MLFFKQSTSGSGFLIAANALMSLHLEDVCETNDTVIDSSSLELFSFRSLDLLKRNCFNFNLSISGDKLETISVKCVGHYVNSSCKVSAPNLKFLEWYGTLPSELNFGELPCLKKADLSLFYGDLVAVDDSTMKDLLSSIRRVKFLILKEAMFKALSKQDFMSAQFDSVSYLRLESIILTDDLMPLLINLLRAMINLRTLDLKSSSYMNCDDLKVSGYNLEFWKSQTFAFLDKLKGVTLDVYHGSNILEFARYVLESAQNLEKIDIYYHFPHQHDAVMNLESNVISKAPVRLHEVRCTPPSFW